jgi:TolC family type I secretion outer membrane protein
MSHICATRANEWLTAVVICAAGCPCALAAEPSDPFSTRAEIQRDLPGMTDPTGYSCAIPGEALTIARAVDLALCRNPSTRAAWAAAHEQAAALGQTESAWLPQLGITGSGSHVFGNHLDTAGGLTSSAQNEGDAALSLSWTLYDFGARTGRISNARHLLDAAAYTINSVSQQTVLNAVQSYYGVVAADAAQEAAKVTESVTAHSLEVAQALRNGGAGTLADVLQAETAHDQAMLTRVQADAAAATARGTLANSLGLLADQRFSLAAEPIPEQVPALTSRVSDLMAEAAHQRPDLAAAQAQREAAEANISVARAAGLPLITMSAGHDLVATTGVQSQNYSLVGLNVTIPIFTGYSVTYGVRQAQAAAEASEINVEQVRLGVSLGVWNAYYALDSANQQLTATAALNKTAEDNEQVALGRYQAGVGTIVDVLTAQAAAATARQVRIQAEFGWRVARAQLVLAIGRLTGAEPLGVGVLPP